MKKNNVKITELKLKSDLIIISTKDQGKLKGGEGTNDSIIITDLDEF